MSNATIQHTFASYRSPVLARRGMVAASQPLAAQAGLHILMQGGNAADAAIATAAALNVTEPCSTGLGGDCFALYYEARTQNVTALNGSGRTPAALTLQRAQHDNGQNNPYHPHTVTVPGACAGWCDFLARHGSMPLPQVLAPAIELAEQGFPVSPLTAHFWAAGAERIRHSPGGLALTLNGRGPRPGEVFRNPGLARTLRTIAAGGKAAYYQGEIAASIVRVLQQAGGVMTLEDLAQHESTWETPLSTVYRDLRVWECPPNGQGLTALLALNILAGLDLAAHAPLSVMRWHYLIEALRLAFADARWYVADPQFAPAPLAALLSPAYSATRRAQLNPQRAHPNPTHGAPVASSDTVYFCVVDGQGNACSFINSNYMGFGTGIVPFDAQGSWGFSLQNRGANFSLDAQHPNVLAPRKRPYHTIIPGLLTHSDGTLYGPFGVMGGFMQPQGHVQVVVALADDGCHPQAALDRLRFCIEAETVGGAVLLEAGLPPDLVRALAALGHQLTPEVGGYQHAHFGRGQLIHRDPEGVLWGGSDPRADGCAMGF